MKGLAIWCLQRARAFGKNDAGAVTVDWVVLTAALCGLIIAIFTILTESVYENAAQGISDTVAEAGELYR